MAALRQWVASFNPYRPEQLSRDGVAAITVEESSVKRQAGKVVALAFVAFAVWAFTAPLDRGAVVLGTVVVEGSRKAVQHPSGGVVEEIRVKEGQEVKEGDLLLRVNPLNVQANLQQAEVELINALAAQSRLLAERLESTQISWDPELTRFAANSHLRQAQSLQAALLGSRLSEYRGQREILLRQKSGQQQQLIEKEKVLNLRKSQMPALEEDAKSLRQLAEDGFVPRTSANGAERSSVEAQIGITTLASEIANLRVSIATVELELVKLKSGYLKAIESELNEAQKAKETLRSRVQALKFDQQLTAIRAPIGGIIVGQKVFTVGGVISGGQVLMEIVPKEQRLIIQAAVPPDLIDKIAVGMPADVRFTALNRNSTPVIPGVVKMVGADRLPPAPPLFPTEHFLAHVETTAEGLKLLGDESIVAGMSAEVVIKGGERTFMSYLFKPLIDRLVLAFKD